MKTSCVSVDTHEFGMVEMMRKISMVAAAQVNDLDKLTSRYRYVAAMATIYRRLAHVACLNASMVS